MPVILLIFAIVLLSFISILLPIAFSWLFMLIPLSLLALIVLWIKKSLSLANIKEKVIIYKIVDCVRPNGNKVQYAVCDGEQTINVTTYFKIVIGDINNFEVQEVKYKNYGYGLQWDIGEDYVLVNLSENGKK